jgi:hypothetical protein
MSDALVNKVAQSGLIQLDLEEWLARYDWIAFDLRPFLWQEAALREAEYRSRLKEGDWTSYAHKRVYIPPVQDVILPQWSYLLASSVLSEYADSVFVGTKEEAQSFWLLEQIAQLDLSVYQNTRVVLKGCTSKAVTSQVQVAMFQRLKPVVLSFMYGEPCSTVPIYKRK